MCLKLDILLYKIPHIITGLDTTKLPALFLVYSINILWLTMTQLWISTNLKNIFPCSGLKNLMSLRKNFISNHKTKPYFLPSISRACLIFFWWGQTDMHLSLMDMQSEWGDGEVLRFEDLPYSLWMTLILHIQHVGLYQTCGTLRSHVKMSCVGGRRTKHGLCKCVRLLDGSHLKTGTTLLYGRKQR